MNIEHLPSKEIMLNMVRELHGYANDCAFDDIEVGERGWEELSEIAFAIAHYCKSCT